MYIAPDSTVKLIKNLRLSPVDTAFFSTPAAQEAYFSSKAFVTLTDYTVVRHTRGLIYVNLPIGRVFGTSYMMFKNTSFENKWFYAFVTNYEYVNNDTTAVFFSLDLNQTYLAGTDYTLLESMVARMSHPLRDLAGDNIIPESLDTGEMVFEEVADSNLLWTGDWKICVFTTLNNNGDAQSTVDGQIMGGVYSGLNMYEFATDAAGVQAVNNYLSQVSACGAENSVVAIVMLPDVLLRMNTNSYTYTFTINDHIDNGSGYVPRNKKLLTSPFKGIYVTNGQGVVASYSIEYFQNVVQPQFNLRFSLGCVSDCMLQPINYKGGARQFGVELSGFPQCAYTTDGFKAWMARNGNILAINQTMLETQTGYANQQILLQDKGAAITTNASIAGLDLSNKNIANEMAMKTRDAQLSPMWSIAGGDIKGAVRGFMTTGDWLGVNALARQNGVNMMAQNMLSQDTAKASFENAQASRSLSMAQNNEMLALQTQLIAAQKHVASLTPPSFHGQSVGNASKLMGDFGYHVGIFHAPESFVRNADDFFDAYGYSQNRIMPPYRKTRKWWTYLKTAGLNAYNHNVPDEDMRAIKALYDAGIRWWVNPDTIGGYYDFVPGTSVRYNEDNTPLSNPEL